VTWNAPQSAPMVTEAIHVEDIESGHIGRGPSIWRRSGLWWMGDTFTKEVLVGLIPPRLDAGVGVPGWSLLDQ